MNYFIIGFLLILSAVFSGLTLGLLSLDKSELERKIKLGNKQAKKVYAVRKRGNLLLCTLLLGNVAVNSTLAIFLGDITSGLMAGIISTALILIFGEIIPQASFSRYALQVGAYTAWLVKIFMVVLMPLTWPIAWALDKVLGEEMPTIYSKKELMKIIEEHEDSQHSRLDDDEERIIKGALSYSDKTAYDIMTPRTVVYGLDINTKLTAQQLNKIKKAGFTRIPVYNQSIDDVKGVLHIVDLINAKVGTELKKIIKPKKLLIVDEGIKLDDLLNKFLKTKNHLALVQDKFNGLEGVVSLEDVIEEIIKQEIVDETDRVADLQKKARVNKK